MHNKSVCFSFLISVLTILVSLSACSQTQQEKLIMPTGANTSFPTAQISPLATNTVRSSPIPPTQTLTSTLRPKPTCPVPNSQVTVRDEEWPAEIEQAVLDYLNQGGFPQQLQKEMNKINDKGILGPSQVFIVDMNTDDIREIVLAINFGPAPIGGSYLDVHGNLYIYNCVDGKYDVTQVVAGDFADTLKILAIENLLGSDAPEILISRRWTYLDSYYEFVEVYTLTEEGWVLSFQSPDSRCGIQAELKNRADGRKELVITGSNHCPNDTDASLTGKKRTYAFEGNEVKLIQEEPFPPP
jgi:hypothetical protein